MTAQNKTNLRPALLLASRRSSRELRNQRTTADLGSGCWVVGALRRWGAEKMGPLPRTCDKKHLDKSREDSRVRAECGRDSLPTGQRGLLGLGVGLPYGRVRAGSLSDPPPPSAAPGKLLETDSKTLPLAGPRAAGDRRQPEAGGIDSQPLERLPETLGPQLGPRGPQKTLWRGRGVAERVATPPLSQFPATPESHWSRRRPMSARIKVLPRV